MEGGVKAETRPNGQRNRLTEAEYLVRDPHLYRRLFEAMGSGVAIYRAVDGGTDFEFLDFNPAAERIDRISRADVVGRRVTVVFPSVREFGLLDVFQRVWATGRTEHHPIRLYRDGRISGWRNNQVFKLPSGEVVVVYDDLTKEKEFEHQFRQLAQNIREVFWISSPDWKEMMYVSPAYEEVWGKPCRELYEDPNSWFDAIHADDKEAVALDLSRKCESDYSDPQIPVFRVVRPDREVRWISARGFPIRDERGRVVRIAGLAEDVTERIRAEGAAQEAENRFRATFEQAAVGMAHIGLDGRFLRLNDKLCEITGYSRTELQSRTFQDITHPDDLDADLALARDLWAGRIPFYRIEKRYFRKDGRVVWINLTASAALDPQGRPEYCIAVIEDISLRKEAEAVRASEELQRMALSAAKAGAWEYDFTTGAQIWSPEIYEIFGLDPPRKPPNYEAWLSQCVHPDDRVLFAHLQEAVKKRDGEFQIEYRSPHPQKGLQWLTSLGRLIRDSDNRPLRAYGLTLNVTEQRQMQEELRANEARLRMAMAAGDIGIWDWDIASGHVSWSENLARFMQMDTFGGTVEAFRALVHPDDRQRVATALKQALAGKSEYRLEFRMKNSEGKVRWTETRGSVVRDQSGQPVRMIGIDMEITDRKAAEEHQALLGSELNHRVKNLLSTIQSIVTQTLASTGSKEEFRDAFSARLHALARGNDLLIRSNWRPVELTELLHTALDSFSPRYRIAVHCEGVRLPPRTALALNLILHELATNAAKYGALSAPQGVVEIDCHHSEEEPGVVVCRWEEKGGPPVQAPEKRGFGSLLIDRMAGSDLGRDAKISYRPEGVECLIRFAAPEGALAAAAQ